MKIAVNEVVSVLLDATDRLIGKIGSFLGFGQVVK